MQIFDEDDEAETEQALIEQSNDAETRDKITLVKDEYGTWHCVVRINGRGKEYIFQEMAYHFEPDDERADRAVLIWANELMNVAALVD